MRAAEDLMLSNSIFRQNPVEEIEIDLIAEGLGLVWKLALKQFSVTSEI